MGLGIVSVPEVVRGDPATTVLVDPSIPEHRRFCRSDKEPVGRGRGDQPGRATGFCPKCGTPFSFVPALCTGEVLAGQYEIAGCLAHGGLGWVYLARDLSVEDRWVVLKGLLDANDPEATVAALAERRFLATVKHPNIVTIHNFVQHEGQGYIVMEHVDGVSLRQMLQQRRDANNGQASPIPVEQAITYVLEALPALGHLHGLQLAYCDFKPDNVMVTSSSVKLIDLGGVFRFGDTTSEIFGTSGFQAPEVGAQDPSVGTDLYTVGRTLAVLCTDFTGFQTTHRYALRSPSDEPLYEEFDSLYRFLERATAFDPDDRFTDATEMAEQLSGVLREIVAAQTGKPVSGRSTAFAPSGKVPTAAPSWRALPRPAVDPSDPGAPIVLSLAHLRGVDALESLPPEPGSLELDLFRLRLLIDVRDMELANGVLEAIEAADPYEWRGWWYHGIVALTGERPIDAVRWFDAVYCTLPGELAPKLALGLAHELSANPAGAASWYEIVSRTDPEHVAASFGLARCRILAGDCDGAVAALGRVPETSGAHVEACVVAVGLLLDREVVSDRARSVERAAEIADRLDETDEPVEALRASVLDVALDVRVHDDGAGLPPTVFEVQTDERSLRLALERAYRSLAGRAPTRRERIELVDRANAVRPRTLV